MSRKIDVSDPSSLSKEDIEYLQERDKLPAGVDPVIRPGLTNMALAENTGQVDTGVPDGGASIADPPSPTRSSEYEPVNDALDPSQYGDATVAQLKAEVDRRNEGREEGDLLDKPSKKAELIDVLNADDEVIQ